MYSIPISGNNEKRTKLLTESELRQLKRMLMHQPTNWDPTDKNWDTVLPTLNMNVCEERTWRYLYLVVDSIKAKMGYRPNITGWWLYLEVQSHVFPLRSSMVLRRHQVNEWCSHCELLPILMFAATQLSCPKYRIQSNPSLISHEIPNVAWWSSFYRPNSSWHMQRISVKWWQKPSNIIQPFHQFQHVFITTSLVFTTQKPKKSSGLQAPSPSGTTATWPSHWRPCEEERPISTRQRNAATRCRDATSGPSCLKF